MIRKVFRYRTQALIATTVVSVAALVFIGLTSNLVIAIALLVVWGLMYAAALPMKQAYLHSLIGSEDRATILSFDSLMGSTGGVVFQPALGRAADVWSYSVSYLITAGVQALAIPFLILARREKVSSDVIEPPTEDSGAA
jgi:MFS family permease